MSGLKVQIYAQIRGCCVTNVKEPGKKVAIIIPTFAGGGAERFASNLGFSLSKKWDVVNILYENRVVYPCAGKLITIDSPPGSHALDKIFKLFSRILKIRRIKRKEGIDVSISVMESANVVNILSAGRDKTIISTRSFRAVNKDTRDFYTRVYKFLMRLLYHKVDMTVTVSSLIAQNMIDDFNVQKDRVKVIYNPVDIQSVEALSREGTGEFERIMKSPVIITVGRLTFAKGQWHLIKAFRKVKDAFPDARLMIVGDGELKSDLTSLCHALSLKTWRAWAGETMSDDYDVYFTGFRQNPFMLMARARVFVLPSLWEGFPNVLVEAMVCGVPVIASDCRSGPREILAPGTDLSLQTQKPDYGRYGVLMPVCDSGKDITDTHITSEEGIWSDVLVRSLTDEEFSQRYKALAKTRILDFKKEHIAQEWEKVIDTVVNNGYNPHEQAS